MKNILKYISITSLILFALVSCEYMDDFHYEYIKDGEIVYSTKLDSVTTNAGNERIQINGILNQPFGVEQIKIYYNDRADSTIVNYDQVNSIDTINILLEDMEEKSYAFEIFTINSDGNRSIKVDAFATSYGEIYTNNLQPRVIDSDSTKNNILYLNWLPADEMERGAEIVYTNTSDEEITLHIAQDSNNVHLANFKEGISYRSFYVPEVTALDTFASIWTDLELQIFESTGVFNHPLLGEEPFALDKVLRTIAPSTYELEFANKGVSLGYRLKLKVDSENNVILSSVGSTPAVIPNGDNTFDPNTNTFTLNYKYDHLTGERIITETLVKK